MHTSGKFHRSVNTIYSITLALSGCKVGFEPDIMPLDMDIPGAENSELEYRQVDGDFESVEVLFFIDKSRQAMLLYAEFLGFGVEEKLHIDDLFDPFCARNAMPYDVDILIGAGEILYNQFGGIDRLSRNYRNNPLNYLDEDPLFLLRDEHRGAMACTMVGSMERMQFKFFLEEIEANPYLIWNYEPVWLAAQIEAHPREYLKAQREYLRTYAIDPDVWDYLEEVDPKEVGFGGRVLASTGSANVRWAQVSTGSANSDKEML